MRFIVIAIGPKLHKYTFVAFQWATLRITTFRQVRGSMETLSAQHRFQDSAALDSLTFGRTAWKFDVQACA